MTSDEQRSIFTAAVHAGGGPDPATGAVVPGIQPSTTFARDEAYELPGPHVYSRYGHPGSDLVEQAAAVLDGGAEGLAFSSGMAAIACLFETVDAGAHVVAPSVMYHGAQAWLRRIAGRRGIGLDLVDPGDPDALAAAVRPATDIVWIESPVNPTWDVIDIAAVAGVAHSAGALLAVDSTVAPPVTTRPLDLGADLVFHSATKYYNGHGDVTAGLLVTARTDERWSEIRAVRTLLGGVLPPFEAWLLQRGMRTMPLRYTRASAGALEVARFLEGHPAVERVLYPGLERHPGHAIAARQMTGGFGGMLSILVDGDAASALRVASRLQLFTRATSLGSVESLVEHRASIEGPESIVPPNLLRLSIGLEDPDDLIADLEAALSVG